MSEIFDRILELVAARKVLISDHGYDELAVDDILVTDVYELPQPWWSPPTGRIQTAGRKISPGGSRE